MASKKLKTSKKLKILQGNEINYLLLFSVLIFLDRIFKVSVSGCNFLFCITYSKNYGAAFGILQNQVPLLVAVSVILLFAVMFFFLRAKSSLLRIALTFLAAGIIGNMIDRVCYGFVIDIIKINAFSFNLFNIADLSNCIGAVLLVAYILKKR